MVAKSQSTEKCKECGYSVERCCTNKTLCLQCYEELKLGIIRHPYFRTDYQKTSAIFVFPTNTRRMDLVDGEDDEGDY